MSDLALLLEIEAIKRLKYKYFRCLDSKRWAELAECFVEDKDLGRLGPCHLGGCVEREMRLPPCVMPAPCMLDEHASHHQGGDGEEVRAALPAHLALAEQPQEGLMDQGPGLEEVPRTFPVQIAGGELSQLAVDEGSQAIEGLTIALAPGDEQVRECLTGHFLPQAAITA